MAYLDLFSIIFISSIMGSLATSEVDKIKKALLSEIEDDGRLFFGTSSSATTGTGTGGGTTATQITGWETTLIVGVAFAVIFIIWIFLMFGLPLMTTDDLAKVHSAPGGFLPHDFTASGDYSSYLTYDPARSYDVYQHLESAARKFQ